MQLILRDGDEHQARGLVADVCHLRQCLCRVAFEQVDDGEHPGSRVRSDLPSAHVGVSGRPELPILSQECAEVCPRIGAQRIDLYYLALEGNCLLQPTLLLDQPRVVAQRISGSRVQGQCPLQILLRACPIPEKPPSNISTGGIASFVLWFQRDGPLGLLKRLFCPLLKLDSGGTEQANAVYLGQERPGWGVGRFQSSGLLENGSR